MPDSPLPYPQSVLERRMVKRRNQAAMQWMIHWENSSSADATWEYTYDFQIHFSDLIPRGQGTS